MSKRGKSSRRRHLASSSGAAYEPQYFVITFAANTPYIREVARVDGRDVLQQDPRYFHVFAHEYWHYWHNFSTTAGMKQFFAMQELLALFSRTVEGTGDGTSLGAAALGGERERLLELSRIAANLQGQGAPTDEFLYDLDVMFVLDDVRPRAGRGTYNNSSVPADDVVLELTVLANGSQTKEEMVFGSIAIEEGIAILVEEHCADKIEGAIYEAAPEFPYRLLQAMVKHVARRDVSAFAIAALGTLALLSTHPGPALLHLAKEFGNRIAEGLDEADALDGLIAESRELRVKAAEVVKQQMEGVATMHRERGAVELAVRYLQAQSELAFQFRIDHPVTDLAFVFNDDPIGSLDGHIKRFPPCDVLQMRTGSEKEVMRDGLVPLHVFAPLDNGLTLSDCMRSLQAQQDYLAAHSAEDGDFVDSNRATPHACPFFTSCDLHLRNAEPAVCANSPWKSLDRSSNQACWYAGGVAATLGPVIAKGLLARSEEEERALVRRGRIRLAAYYRWLGRGGASAPEAALEDWLWAEAELATRT